MFDPQGLMKLGEAHAIADIKLNLDLARVLAEKMSRPLTPYGLGYFHTVTDYVKVKA